MGERRVPRFVVIGEFQQRIGHPVRVRVGDDPVLGAVRAVSLPAQCVAQKDGLVVFLWGLLPRTVLRTTGPLFGEQKLVVQNCESDAVCDKGVVRYCIRCESEGVVLLNGRKTKGNYHVQRFG